MDDEAELYRSTVQRFLEQESPLRSVRARATEARGFEPSLWTQAAALGWTSLLVPEAHGGGSVTGRPLADLAMLADLCGTHLAPGPLLPTNLVAAAVARSGTPGQQSELLASVVAGELVAAWAHEEPGRSPLDLGSLAATAVARPDGTFELRGTKSPVEAGALADRLLVTARCDGAPAQFLVEAGAAGLEVTPLRDTDLSRRFARIELDGVVVPASARVGADAADAIEWQLALAAVVTSVEAAGAARALFEMTVAYAFDRYAFGRPLASYQALKHRFADMKVWLEASHAVARQAADQLDAGDPVALETASAAKAYTGQFLAELGQDCIQIHGGIGLTAEHDAHLFLRRILVDRQTYGTPADHRQHIAGLREAVA